jgi:hypothetical protein
MYIYIYMYISKYKCISIYVNGGSDDESTMSDLEDQDYGIHMNIHISI